MPVLPGQFWDWEKAHFTRQEVSLQQHDQGLDQMQTVSQALSTRCLFYQEFWMPRFLKSWLILYAYALGKTTKLFGIFAFKNPNLITGTKVKRHKCFDNRQIHCEFCSKVSTRRAEFYKHVNCFHLQEISKLWFKCTSCDNYYPTKSIVNLHKQSHKKRENIQCQFCPEMFFSVSAFHKHAHLKHQQPLAGNNISLTAGTHCHWKIVQSISVITNSSGPAKFVHYNQFDLCD